MLFINFVREFNKFTPNESNQLTKVITGTPLECMEVLEVSDEENREFYVLLDDNKGNIYQIDIKRNNTVWGEMYGIVMDGKIYHLDSCRFFNDFVNLIIKNCKIN